MGDSAVVPFKVKEKAVLAYFLTIPEVACAVALQRAGRPQEAKAGLRAAVAQLPPELLKQAGALRPGATGRGSAASVSVPVPPKMANAAITG
mmetsp:Transcript_87304/g.255369  ORF Transcript_87304/g.255369 Transcript_87304/m.255369 type:complete len:92 (-) Transcript_87304:7-282(-)